MAGTETSVQLNMTFTNPSNGPYQATKGDIVAGTGSGAQPTIISVGTNGQVMTANSGLTGGMGWSNAGSGGALVLIQTQTASNSASLNFTSGFSYKSYLFILNEVIPSSNNVGFLGRVSTDGGSTYLNTGYAYATIAGGSFTTSYTFSGSYGIGSGQGGMNGQITFNVGSVQTFLEASLVGYSPGTTTYQYWPGGGVGPPNANAFQFKFSGSNIASGTISLYGYNQ